MLLLPPSCFGAVREDSCRGGGEEERDERPESDGAARGTDPPSLRGRLLGRSADSERPLSDRLPTIRSITRRGISSTDPEGRELLPELPRSIRPLSSPPRCLQSDCGTVRGAELRSSVGAAGSRRVTRPRQLSPLSAGADSTRPRGTTPLLSLESRASDGERRGMIRPLVSAGALSRPGASGVRRGTAAAPEPA